MPRTVFFSFHYQRDIFRVQQVKRHYIAKEGYIEAGFFDGSLEEKAETEGDDVVRRLIDRGMSGSSVLCVLIGKETYTRRWVDYEILHAVGRGMGIFGIWIHTLKDPRPSAICDYPDKSDNAGANPFQFLRYMKIGTAWQPMIHYTGGWTKAHYQTTIGATSAPPYFGGKGLLGEILIGNDQKDLNRIFWVHDWVRDDGFHNFGSWVEAAAHQAGR